MLMMCFSKKHKDGQQLQTDSDASDVCNVMCVVVLGDSRGYQVLLLFLHDESSFCFILLLYFDIHLKISTPEAAKQIAKKKKSPCQTFALF